MHLKETLLRTPGGEKPEKVICFASHFSINWFEQSLSNIVKYFLGLGIDFKFPNLFLTPGIPNTIFHGQASQNGYKYLGDFTLSRIQVL